MFRRSNETDDVVKLDADSRSWQILSGAILLIGGILTVSVLLKTEANLSAEVIRNVLLPGTAIGMVLMLIGGVGVIPLQKRHMQKRHTH